MTEARCWQCKEVVTGFKAVCWACLERGSDLERQLAKAQQQRGEAQRTAERFRQSMYALEERVLQLRNAERRAEQAEAQRDAAIKRGVQVWEHHCAFMAGIPFVVNLAVTLASLPAAQTSYCEHCYKPAGQGHDADCPAAQEVT